MASRCCGSRLSLPNQYDTKTPRASLSSAAARSRTLSGLFVARPGIYPGPSRVTNQVHSVGLEMSLEKSLKFRQRKISKSFFGASRPPDLAFRTSALVLENVAPAEGKPQAVLKYRFLSSTSCLDFCTMRKNTPTADRINPSSAKELSQ